MLCGGGATCSYQPRPGARTTDTQWRHELKISEKSGQCGGQNMLPPYLKIWDWDWIFGHAVKTISPLGVRSLRPGVIIGAISLRSIIITAFIHLAMRVWLAKAYCCATERKGGEKWAACRCRCRRRHAAAIFFLIYNGSNNRVLSFMKF